MKLPDINKLVLKEATKESDVLGFSVVFQLVGLIHVAEKLITIEQYLFGEKYNELQPLD